MNAYEFMGAHPVLAVILALILMATIEVLGRYLINRPLRHANIRKHGYPPSHCDADGDFLKGDDE